MKKVFTPEACVRLGKLLADCQKNLLMNGNHIVVTYFCRDLEMSTATFYRLREAK